MVINGYWYLLTISQEGKKYLEVFFLLDHFISLQRYIAVVVVSKVTLNRRSTSQRDVFQNFHPYLLGCTLESSLG